MSRYTFKNWMNALTDLQKTQYMLLGTQPPYVLRSSPRVQRLVQMFKRTTTMALRRYGHVLCRQLDAAQGFWSCLPVVSVNTSQKQSQQLPASKTEQAA